MTGVRSWDTLSVMGEPNSVVASNRDQHLDANFDGVLPAAGAYTDQDYEKIPPFARRLSVYVNYTVGSGGANGQAQFKFQWRIVSEEGFFETMIDASTTTVGDPEIVVPEYELVVQGPTYASGSGAYRLLSVEVPSCATGVRVLASESGDTAHPGTVTVRVATSDVL